MSIILVLVGVSTPSAYIACNQNINYIYTYIYPTYTQHIHQIPSDANEQVNRRHYYTNTI